MVQLKRVALAFLTTGALVDAHGLLSTPVVEFKEGVMKTSFVGTMTAPSDGNFDGKFDGNPQENLGAFLAGYHKAYPGKPVNVSALVGGDACGNSLDNVSPKPIPADGKIVWENPDTHEGFVASHTGPCELWLDGVAVFRDDNCAGHFATGSKAKIPIDFSSCKKPGCMLKFYWLTLQEPKWQIYKNCVPLIGNSDVGAEAKIKTNSYGSTTELSPSPSPSPTVTEYVVSSSPSPTPTPTTTAAGGTTSYLVVDPTPSVTPKSTPTPSTPTPSSSSPSSGYTSTPAPASGASPSVSRHKCKGKKQNSKPQY